METVLYWLARGAITLLQALPLAVVARLGRFGGWIAYGLDRRHRRAAIENLTACFQAERSTAEIRALARENFLRIGENFASSVKTASMSADQLRPHLEIVGGENLAPAGSSVGLRSRVVAIGHFGNFELYVHLGRCAPGLQPASTYRALRQPSLNRLLQSLRERSACRFFERRRGVGALKEALSGTPLLLGLLADQHAGQGGRRVPFFGRDCATNVAPAVFALRYDCALHTAICYRLGLGRWRIEVAEEIPTHEQGKPRTVEALMTDVNRAFEIAVRRDPANWFWVHNRWKPPRTPHPDPRPEPIAGEEA
jgi:KDO2-lipid IV(A) lauroyltransferase